jgi:hypothetical protein
MIPFRRSGAFISRISITIILISSSLFIIFGLTKYLFKDDSQRFVPVESNLFKNNYQSHNHEQHGEFRRLQRPVKTKRNH